MLASLLGAATPLAQAQPAEFPIKGKPIRVIVAFPPGIGVDAQARAVTPKLAEILGVPVVIENKPGGGTLLAALEVLRAAPDGHIAAVQLSPAVPEPIAVQFETARNLYIYAWHVYRFYMVAATQALTTLEFGLRERLPARLPAPYQRAKQKQPMRAGMLRYAIDQGLVRNHGFRRWHQAAEQQARERRSLDAIQAMIDQGLERIEIDDDSPVEVAPQDQQWDLVAILGDSLPSLRNQLAHGSPMLTHQVLGSLELVAEILSQLYPDQPATGS